MNSNHFLIFGNLKLPNSYEGILFTNKELTGYCPIGTFTSIYGQIRSNVFIAALDPSTNTVYATEVPGDAYGKTSAILFVKNEAF